MFTRFQFCRATVGLSIVLTMAPNPGRAVDRDQPATSYLRTTFTVEDGLSSNVVNAILQTRNGFLWIGTDAGLKLNRFDGRHFTPIYFRGPRSTPQGIVTSLAEGPDGDLWIGTSAGLVRISRRALDQFDRSLSVFYRPGSDEITCLHVARDGTLLVGTSAGLYRLVGNQFNTLIPNGLISRIEESIDGRLFIVNSQGFVEVDGTRVVTHPELSEQLGIHPVELFHVFQDSKGTVWFCTGAGLARRVNGSIERIQPYGVVERFQPFGVGGGHVVLRVYEDPQANLWVWPSTGFFRISGTKLEPVAPTIQVRAARADREGNL